MTLTPVFTDKISGSSLLPLDPWPEISDIPLINDYPEIEEDTVEIDLPRF